MTAAATAEMVPLTVPVLDVAVAVLVAILAQEAVASPLTINAVMPVLLALVVLVVAVAEIVALVPVRVVAGLVSLGKVAVAELVASTARPKVLVEGVLAAQMA